MKKEDVEKYLSYVVHRTIIWLGEEIHEVECDSNSLVFTATLLFYGAL